MKSIISATEAAHSFSELMNRIRYRGESFVVERGGKPVCEIVPVVPQHFSGRQLAELLHGVIGPAQRHRRQAFVEGLLAQLPVIAFDLAVARVHASLWAVLAKRGVLLGERDLMIGATAIARNFAVATGDADSFSKIPGPKVEAL